MNRQLRHYQMLNLKSPSANDASKSLIRILSNQSLYKISIPESNYNTISNTPFELNPMKNSINNAFSINSINPKNQESKPPEKLEQMNSYNNKKERINIMDDLKDINKHEEKTGKEMNMNNIFNKPMNNEIKEQPLTQRLKQEEEDKIQNLNPADMKQYAEEKKESKLNNIVSETYEKYEKMKLPILSNQDLSGIPDKNNQLPSQEINVEDKNENELNEGKEDKEDKEEKEDKRKGKTSKKKGKKKLTKK